ncbi:AAA domain-containing protein, partial [Actinomadura bangladeshensis]|uniref:AAA domain-containing protein n=1 Tax=Actinomadura bangladeshensis TaxID=453573 RepID=UPI0030B847A5
MTGHAGRHLVPVAADDLVPSEAAARVVDGVLADLAGGHRGVVVDSPPGAGKSTLVVRAAAHLAEAGERLMIVAQTNEQVDDLIERIAGKHPAITMGRLSASQYVPSERVLAHPQVKVAQKAGDLAERTVVIATAAKWATLSDGSWPWAIVDEAYQMRSDMLLRIAGRFERALFVGDPGQLDPFSTVEVERWAGLSWDPMRSAVSVLLAHNPDLPVHRLPVSWRLPASAAPVVSRAFYPFTGFRAGTEPGDRRLEFGAGGMGTTYDRALEEAAATGWALYELPARHTLRTDAEAVRA